MTNEERAAMVFNGLEVVDVAINLGATDTYSRWPAMCDDDTALIKRAIDAACAESVAAAKRWTPVGEGLPESANHMVLVTYTWAGTPCVCAACYDPDSQYWDAGDWCIGEVIAWQPLPAAWVAP